MNAPCDDRTRSRRTPRLLTLLAAASLVAWGLLGGTTPAQAATTDQDVIDAFATGGALTLDADVTVSEGLTLAAGRSLILDLAGHTLTVTGTPVASGEAGSTGLVVDGHLTVRDGHLDVTGGRGGTGAAGAAGTPETPDGQPGDDGGRGGDSVVVGSGAVVSTESVTVRLTCAPGGAGGAGGAGHDGLPGEPGGHGGPGGAAGSTGTCLINNGVFASVGGGLTADSAGTVGNAAGGPGGDGGNGGAGAVDQDGGAGGNGGDGGQGGTFASAIVNHGPLLLSGSTLIRATALGQGGAGGAAGSGGPGERPGPDGVAGAAGPRGTHPTADSLVSSRPSVTVIGNGDVDPSHFGVHAATVGEALSLIEEYAGTWPQRRGYAFDGWWTATAGGQPVSPHEPLAGGRIYAHWIDACTTAGLAASFTHAADGETITLCADLTVAAEDGALAVPAGASLTLDLAGYTLNTTGDDARPGVEVGAGSALTVTDSSPAADGHLTASGGSGAAGIGSRPGADSGAITIEAGDVSAGGGCNAAGLGSGAGGLAGTITITGGNVAAAAGAGSTGCHGAGVGAGHGGGAQAITITGGLVEASGAGLGAGIGTAGTYDPDAAGSRTFTMTGGEVLASGGLAGPASGGPGIGAGGGGTFALIEVGDGQLDAHGGPGAAGLGGSGDGRVETVTLEGGTITALGLEGGAGIGGGPGQAGADVTIGAAATVSAAAAGGGNVIGEGAGGAGFGSLTNAGGLTIRGGTLTIPDGVSMTNSGTVIIDAASGAEIVNQGVIMNTGTVENPDDVSVHNYLVAFDANGGELGDAGHDQVRVYGPSLDRDHRPEPPTRAGFVFAGWNSAVDGSGIELVDGDLTVLGDGPVTVTWYAQWTPEPVETPDSPAAVPPLADTGAPLGGASVLALLLTVGLALLTGLTLLRRGRA